MATITKRTNKSGTYFYLVESKRVNGKPRIVTQKYLGTAERIAHAIDFINDNGIPEPEMTTVFDFGAVAALLDIAERLGIREIIDKHANKRAQGLPVSDTILLAAINRVVSPTSKKSFYDWYSKTVLYKTFPNANAKNLSSQGFWNNMGILNETKIRSIEDELTKTVVYKYDIPTDCLLFDNTNFFTYMDTSNPATLAKRGHSKQKRSDLKIVGLSMMVSPDHNVPLFHEAYPGNRNDAKQFSEVVDQLKERYKKLGIGECEPTLVFDKGNNNEKNIERILAIDPCPFHFVGGLRLNQCAEMLGIPLSQFQSLDGAQFHGALAHRTVKNVYDRDLTIVITYNPVLYEAQLDGVMGNIAKCEKALAELKEKLRLRHEGHVTKGKTPTENSLRNSADRILSSEHMKDIFDYEIIGEPGKCPELKYTLNMDQFDALKERKLGKSILFTDRHDWANEKIVGAYRSQYHVEDAFRQMKDTKYLSFRPIHHFTDEYIRVHALYCVIALTLATLLNKEVEALGEKISVHCMLDKFQDAQQVITIYPGNGKKKVVKSSFSRLEGIVKDYVEKYDLKKYADKL